MLNSLLRDQNPVIRYGVATIVVFGPLYLLQSYGFRWPFLVAILILLGLLITRQRSGQPLGFPVPRRTQR